MGSFEWQGVVEAAFCCERLFGILVWVGALGLELWTPIRGVGTLGFLRAP